MRRLLLPVCIAFILSTLLPPASLLAPVQAQNADVEKFIDCAFQIRWKAKKQQQIDPKSLAEIAKEKLGQSNYGDTLNVIKGFVSYSQPLDLRYQPQVKDDQDNEVFERSLSFRQENIRWNAVLLVILLEGDDELIQMIVSPDSQNVGNTQAALGLSLSCRSFPETGRIKSEQLDIACKQLTKAFTSSSDPTFKMAIVIAIRSALESKYTDDLMAPQRVDTRERLYDAITIFKDSVPPYEIGIVDRHNDFFSAPRFMMELDETREDYTWSRLEPKDITKTIDETLTDLAPLNGGKGSWYWLWSLPIVAIIVAVIVSWRVWNGQAILPTQQPFSGKIRNQFERRLSGSWRELANVLEIPDHTREQWQKGLEGSGIWRYLSSRNALPNLPAALDSIGRPDLSQLFGSGRQTDLQKEAAAILQQLECHAQPSGSNDNEASTGLRLLRPTDLEDQQTLDQLAKKLRESLEPWTKVKLSEPTSHEEREHLLDKLPKFSGLEAAVVGASLGDRFSGADFLTHYESASQKICAIGTQQQHVGTGFLVAPNRIITNWHVWEEVSKLNTQFFACFDRNDPEGSVRCKPALLAGSPVQLLDYAILELETAVDSDRGFFELHAYHPEFRETIHVLGYPGQKTKNNQIVASPLTLRSGVIFDTNAATKRIGYSAETLPGSSGSPVFRENFQLIGLHHHGETRMNNHGIPFWAILEDLDRNRHLVTQSDEPTPPK